MKKSLTLLGYILCLCACTTKGYNLNSIKNESVSESIDYSDYYTYDRYRYLCIYCWQIEPNVWKCGLSPDVSFNYSFYLDFLHMQNCIPCDLNVMKDIIHSYDESKFETIYLYEINFPFDGTRFPSTYLKYLCNELSLPFENVAEECR